MSQVEKVDFTGLYNIRDFRADDANFVRACFLRGLYYGNSFYNLMPQDVFMVNYKPVIESFLINHNVSIKVACLPDDTDTIIGFSIMSKDQSALHWVYVKKDWRNHGIGRKLTPENPQTVSHLTELGKSLMTKLPKTIFNPFRA